MSEPAAQPLMIHTSTQGGATVIALVGSADIDQGEPLRRQLREAAAAAPGNVVLDLHQLSFICSTWLSVLIQLYKEARTRGAQIRLARPVEAIAKMLHTTRLTAIMPVYDTLEQAVEEA